MHPPAKAYGMGPALVRAFRALAPPPCSNGAPREWSCAVCTLSNSPSRRRCVACKAHAPNTQKLIKLALGHEMHGEMVCPGMMGAVLDGHGAELGWVAPLYSGAMGVTPHPPSSHGFECHCECNSKKVGDTRVHEAWIVIDV